MLADRSDKSVVSFTWKTFVTWEIMFYISAALLILKSYYDRFLSKDGLQEDTLEITEEQRELCVHSGYKIRDESNRTILATIDQLQFIRERASQSVLDIIFWINLVANIICINVVFLSEVFVMVFGSNYVDL